MFPTNKKTSAIRLNLRETTLCVFSSFLLSLLISKKIETFYKGQLKFYIVSCDQCCGQVDEAMKPKHLGGRGSDHWLAKVRWVIYL